MSTRDPNSAWAVKIDPRMKGPDTLRFATSYHRLQIPRSVIWCFGGHSQGLGFRALGIRWDACGRRDLSDRFGKVCVLWSVFDKVIGEDPGGSFDSVDSVTEFDSKRANRADPILKGYDDVGSRLPSYLPHNGSFHG